jgi:HEAT repeat protein
VYRKRWIAWIVSAAALLPLHSLPAQTAPIRALPGDVRELAAILKSPSAGQPDRDEAARRLVAIHSDAARAAARTALADLSSRRGQLAIARALAAIAEPDPSLIDPLFALITGESPYTEAAIAALSNYRRPEVGARLLELGRDADHQQREPTRLAAIAALGAASDKPTAQALVAILSNEQESTTIRAAAADALSAMSGITGNGRDPAKWQAWWNAQKDKDDAAFARQMLEAQAARLTRLRFRFARLMDENQTLLADIYQSTPDRAREGVLLRFLKADEASTRAVGVRLIRDEFAQNRPIPAAAKAQLRQMVADSSSDVRIQVARALWELNDASAYDALVAQLASESDEQVRSALADALVPIRDLKVISILVNLLKDPSVDVVQTAAKGLAELGKESNLGPDIRKDLNLVARMSTELRGAFGRAAGSAAGGDLRAALIDAMAPLRNGELRVIFNNGLQAGQPVAVRRASARALGSLGWASQPLAAGAADTLINSLDEDADEGVRLEALDGLKAATFEYAEKIYEHLKSPTESPAVRQRAWDVLCALFPKADASQLNRWADRFMDDPPRRYIILMQLAEMLQKKEDFSQLATVQQNLGDTLMRMNDPENAAIFFDRALQYYQAKKPTDLMTTGSLIDQRMEALLASKQYDKAAAFAAEAIAANQQNQQTMGPKIRNQADKLSKSEDYQGALALIRATKKMNPPLAEVFLGQIQIIEEEARRHVAKSGPATSSSAVGSGAGQ